MLHSHINDRPHVIIRQGIEDGFSLPPELYQLALLQYSQLMGHGGRTGFQHLGNIPHAHFRLKQHVQNFDARGVAEHLVQLRQIVEQFKSGCRASPTLFSSATA